MKHVFKVALIASALFVTTQTFAQDDHHSVGHDVGHAATAVGHKTAEVSAKGAAVVTDKRYRGKMGPDGQTIYINKHSHYFYVNKRGKRIYLSKAELRDKPMK